MPMVKGTFQCMKAAQEFIKERDLGDLEDGWVVSGASKRGWTSFMVGSTEQSLVKIAGIVPLVPIVPDMVKEAHVQWQSYNGFSFAFSDYANAGIIGQLDGDLNHQLMEMIDPIYFNERLDKIPKLVGLSSDDEFMQFDWTGIYWDKLGGEKHLMITKNAEHAMFTNLGPIGSTINTFMRSIGAKHTAKDRPKFDYTFDEETGEITVTIPW